MTKNLILRHVFFLAAVLVLSAGCGIKAGTASAVIRLSEELEITEIERNTFLVTHSFPWPGNSLLLVSGKKDILWIDTPYTPEAASLVLDWAENKFGRDLAVKEINTGFHIDNLGGNAELFKRKIPVYGSGLTCELLKTRSSATMSKMVKWLGDEKFRKYRDVYASFVFSPPSHTFDISREQTVSFGTENAVIYFPGPSHTYDNTVVYLPSRKLLFGGCMILSAEAGKPGYADDGNLAEWEKSMRNLKKKFQDVKIVIPGHGAPGDAGLIGHTEKVIASFVK